MSSTPFRCLRVGMSSNTSIRDAVASCNADPGLSV